MLKKRVYNALKAKLSEFLYGFTEDTIEIGILSGMIELKNLIVRPNKVNEIFKRGNIPISLKAGLISKISIQISPIHLFSGSVVVNVEDVHFILGPSTNNISKHNDFDNADSPYETNQIQNIVRMFQVCKQNEDREKEEHKNEEQKQRQKSREEKKKAKEERAKQKKELAQKKAKQAEEKPSEFWVPPGISWIFSLFQGIKLNINRIHVRYEDDYFNGHRPFSMGLMIDGISLDNTDNHWTFHSPNGMNFTRTENKFINKEFNIARIRFYFNSFSEMLIPTSLWEQTKHDDLQIFSAMDAQEVKDLMVSAFDLNTTTSINRFNLCEPFYVNVAMNFNTMYNPAFKEEPFKYQIVVLVSKLIYTVTPNVLKDIKQLAVYFETFGYSKDIKRYRPTIRIQTMIDACKKFKNRPDLQAKKKLVVRDWFRLILWYVRLRKSSRGQICSQLLEVQKAAGKQIANPVQVARNASLASYKPFFGEEEETPQTTEGQEEPEILSEDEEVLDFIKHEGVKLRSAKAKQEFFDGIKFQVRIDTIEFRLQIPTREIVRYNELLPNFHFTVANICLKLGFVEKDVAIQTTIKEISLVDYYQPSHANKAAVPYAVEVMQLPPSGTNFANMRSSSVSSFYDNQSQANRMSAASKDVDYFQTISQQQRRQAGTLVPGVSQSAQSKLGASLMNPKAYGPSSIVEQQTPARKGRATEATLPPTTNKNKATPSSKATLMDNLRLEKRSESFLDENGNQVDKRCWLLLAGEDDHTTNAITLSISANVFDEPRVIMTPVVSIKVANVIVEVSCEVLESLTKLLPDFKPLFRYTDLYPCRGGLNQRIQLFTPLYMLKQKMIHTVISEQYINSEFERIAQQKENSKSPEDIEKEKYEKQSVMTKKLKGVDRALRKINFKFLFDLVSVCLSLTGEAGQENSHARMFDFGVSKQSIVIEKDGVVLKANAFGVTVNTYYTFCNLFAFVTQFVDSVKVYGNNMAVQISVDQYKKFIKDIEKVKELYPDYSEQEIAKIASFGIEDLVKGQAQKKKIVFNDEKLIKKSDNNFAAHLQFTPAANETQPGKQPKGKAYFESERGSQPNPAAAVARGAMTPGDNGKLTFHYPMVGKQ